jgi:hypothetical protein
MEVAEIVITNNNSSLAGDIPAAFLQGFWVFRFKSRINGRCLYER